MSTTRGLSHPIFNAIRSPARRSITLSAELPKGLNPYKERGVALRLALAHVGARSIKDVVAVSIVQSLWETGALKPGDTAIDASSGNTGRAYAWLLQALGVRLRLIVQGTMAPAKLAQLTVYGEGVEIVAHMSTEETTVERARREAREFGYVALDQYASMMNPRAHERYTGPEIWRQAQGVIGAVVVPLGTCGTALGLSRYLKERDPKIKIIGVAVATEGAVPQIPGMRTIPEIERNVRHEWRPAVDEILTVTRPEAVFGTRRLMYADPAHSGLSTGAAYAAILKHLKSGHHAEYAAKNVIILAPDSIEPYYGIMQAEQDDAIVASALARRPEF